MHWVMRDEREERKGDLQDGRVSRSGMRVFLFLFLVGLILPGLVNNDIFPPVRD